MIVTKGYRDTATVTKGDVKKGTVSVDFVYNLDANKKSASGKSVCQASGAEALSDGTLLRWSICADV